MKHQQVVVDYMTMLKSSSVCLLLAFSGYILLKLVQAVFYLPGHLQRNQERLEELAAKLSVKLDKGTAGDSNEIEPEGENLVNTEEIADEKKKEK